MMMLESWTARLTADVVKGGGGGEGVCRDVEEVDLRVLHQVSHWYSSSRGILFFLFFLFFFIFLFILFYFILFLVSGQKVKCGVIDLMCLFLSQHIFVVHLFC